MCDGRRLGVSLYRVKPPPASTPVVTPVVFAVREKEGGIEMVQVRCGCVC
ncbi:hypothetical protein Hanom_Chr14g01320721 [Helianthus anomalus]